MFNSKVELDIVFPPAAMLWANFTDRFGGYVGMDILLCLHRYLRTQGMDASQHPVREELERVRKTYEKLSKANLKLNKGLSSEEELKERTEGGKPKLNMEVGARFIAANLGVKPEIKKTIKDAGKLKSNKARNKKIGRAHV